MIDLTYLYGERESGSTPHRYGQALKEPGAIPKGHQHAVARSAGERRPIVVWNITRTCNLGCVHCYTDSESRVYPNELTTTEGRALLDDLAAFKVPAVLFSGGEPTVRKDFFELAEYAVGKGLRLVLSTNGTQITPEFAARLKKTGFTYVGISLDGLREVHDTFRRRPGCFDQAVNGIRNCLSIGQKVGLRLTLTRSTARDLDGIFALIERERIPRVCFYHLVPSGRGSGVEDLTLEDSRRVVARVMEKAREWSRGERLVEVLTVDNPCDGPYLYLKLLQEGRTDRAAEVLRLLEWNGGALAGSGVGIADIDPQGNVHPDQFWMDVSFGNVRERPFGEIWMDRSNPLMAGLKDRRGRVGGRCATCRFFSACGGGLRSRAAHATGDAWAADPACYLSDGECTLRAGA